MALSYSKPVFCNYFKQLGDFNNLLRTDLLKFYDNKADLKALIKRSKLETPSEIEWENSSWSRFNELFINEVINS